MLRKLDKIFNKSKKLDIDKNSKIVIMSDCHRGSGNNFDNFLKNRNIFEAALNHYYKRGYTYIELGDGDDMWEVKDYNNIINEYTSTFNIIKKFHNSNRLIMIYGNHDKCKKSPKVLNDYFNYYFNEKTEQKETLFKNLSVYESLVLNYDNHDIFLLHGHQVDIFNDELWIISRLLVRYIWKTLELIGIKDPTGAAKNNKIKKRVERRLKKWCNINNKIIIAGHTHRAIFPKVGEGLYFNDGSCIHPNGITCIEIENGNITLVKWLYKVKKNKTIFIGKEIIKGKEDIVNFYE